MAERRNTEDGGTEKPAWANLSAGLVTGAADDDPSGIATYSQVGAAFGQVAVIGVGSPFVSGTLTIRLDREFTFALGAIRHIVGQCCYLAKYDRSRRGIDDIPAVIGFVINADNASPLVLHHASAHPAQNLMI